MATKKAKPELNNSKLALIWIPIIVALIGLGGGLFAVFYEKPKTFLPNPLLDQAEVLLIEGDNDGAIAKAEEAKAVEADNPRIYLVIYAAQELSGRHDEAVRALQEGTAQVKKRATGGKEIRAVLKAAEFSREDGLAVVAESYRGFGAEFEKLAKRLRELIVDFFRPVVATTTTTKKSATTVITTKKQSSATDIGEFIKKNGKGFNTSGLEIAQLLNCPLTEANEYWNIYSNSTMEIYTYADDRWVSCFTGSHYENRNNLYSIRWTLSSLSIFGVAIGDSVSKASECWERYDFAFSFNDGEVMKHYNPDADISIFAEVENEKIISFFVARCEK